MMENLKIMVISLRNEELQRLPQIFDSLNKLAIDVEKLKITSAKVTKEINLFDNTVNKFQNDIEKAIDHTTQLNKVCKFNLYV